VQKGITTWLALPAKARRDFIAWAKKGRQDSTSRVHAGHALEELEQLRAIIESLGGLDAIRELLNYFGDWGPGNDPQGVARRAVVLTKQYEEKFAALRELLRSKGSSDQPRKILTWRWLRRQRTWEAAQGYQVRSSALGWYARFEGKQLHDDPLSQTTAASLCEQHAVAAEMAKLLTWPIPNEEGKDAT
jgi:hypothetical protein